MTNGHCLCGQTGWSSNGSALWSAYCHCESCRRACGAPVAAFIGVSNGHWACVGTPKTYASSDHATRYFCGNCGSQLGYSSTKYPDEMHFLTASMADPSPFAPTLHVHYQEHLVWFDVDDNLPRRPGADAP